MSAGIAGANISDRSPSGGVATGFFMCLSFVTLTAATVSVVQGDGRGE